MDSSMRLHGFIEISMGSPQHRPIWPLAIRPSSCSSAQADRSLPGVLMKTMKGCNWSCISQAPGWNPGEFGAGDEPLLQLQTNRSPKQGVFFNIRKQLRLKSQHSDLNSARNEIWKCAALGLFDSELPWKWWFIHTHRWATACLPRNRPCGLYQRTCPRAPEQSLLYHSRAYQDKHHWFNLNELLHPIWEIFSLATNSMGNWFGCCCCCCCCCLGEGTGSLNGHGR